MTERSSIPTKAFRYFKRLIYLPHTATETLERLRRLDSVPAAVASGCAVQPIPTPAPAPEVKFAPQVPSSPANVIGTSIPVSNDPVPLAQKHVEKARVFATREDALATLPRGGKFAEIGVAFGDFSEHALRTLEPTRFDAFDIFRLHEIETIWGRPSVETFRGQTHRQFYERRFADEVASGRMRIFEGDSSQLMAQQPDELYDIIYVDGDHTLEGVLRDAEVAAQKLSKSGYLVFNDYIMADHASNSPYGIVQVVNWFCANLGWRVHYVALQRMLFCDICLVRNE